MLLALFRGIKWCPIPFGFHAHGINPKEGANKFLI